MDDLSIQLTALQFDTLEGLRTWAEEHNYSDRPCVKEQLDYMENYLASQVS